LGRFLRLIDIEFHGGQLFCDVIRARSKRQQAFRRRDGKIAIATTRLQNRCFGMMNRPLSEEVRDEFGGE